MKLRPKDVYKPIVSRHWLETRLVRVTHRDPAERQGLHKPEQEKLLLEAIRLRDALDAHETALAAALIEARHVELDRRLEEVERREWLIHQRYTPQSAPAELASFRARASVHYDLLFKQTWFGGDDEANEQLAAQKREGLAILKWVRAVPTGDAWLRDGWYAITDTEPAMSRTTEYLLLIADGTMLVRRRNECPSENYLPAVRLGAGFGLYNATYQPVAWRPLPSLPVDFEPRPLREER